MRSKGIVGCAASLLLASTVSAAQITKNLSKSETWSVPHAAYVLVFVNKFLGQMQRIFLTGRSTSMTCVGMTPTSMSGMPIVVLGQLASRPGMSLVSCIETREQICPTPRQQLRICKLN